MEAIFAPNDRQSVSSIKKQIKNPKRINTNSPTFGGFISRPTENLAPSYHTAIHGGFFLAPPHPQPLSVSCLPSYSYPNRQRQPPLLPLPIPTSHRSLPSRFQDIPSSRKANRTKHHCLITPKKTKQPIARKDDPKTPTKSSTASITVPLGPDPTHLPKDISRVLSSPPPPPSSTANNDVIVNLSSSALSHVNDLVYSPSPPPSSLPLPKFSIRPKVLSCTAEAAGVDTGATDDLRRILRLR